MRLDLWLAAEHKISRSQAQKWIRQGLVWVNDSLIYKTGHEINFEKDDVDFEMPALQKLTLNPLDLKLKILFEDDYCAVVYKPAGLVTHPSPGHYDRTLVHGLLFALKSLSGIGGVERPGIVHRLDKDTEGLLLVAKTDLAHQKLSEAIAQKKVIRKYLAEAEGHFKNSSGEIEAPISRHPNKRQEMAVVSNGKFALTRFQVLKTLPKLSLVECQLETGRTHQIRVHLKSIHHPVIGDPIYHPQGGDGQHLCAYFLGFHHPIDETWREFHIVPLEFWWQKWATIFSEGTE